MEANKESTNKLEDNLQKLKDLYNSQLSSVGINHAETLSTLTELARLSKTLGLFQEADEYYSKALLISESLLGENDIMTLSLLHNYAVLLFYKRSYNESKT